MQQFNYPEEFGERKGRPFAHSVFALTMHLAGTALIFLSFLVLTWAIGFIADLLHSAHPFAPEVHSIVLRVELGFVYVDAILCAVLLVVGFMRFCKDMWGNKS